MKRKLLFLSLGLMLILSVGFPGVASADNGRVGGCPGGFELHEVGHMQHDGEHMHKHVGVDSDRNGDGLICVMHVSVSGDIHVHIDNNAR